MNQLERFKAYIVGDFDNKQQIEKQIKESQLTHPYAKHINRVVNDRIKNLPDELNGFFVLEESYFTTLKLSDEGLVQEDRHRQSSHLFFFTLTEENNVQLISYEIPKNLPSREFTNDNENLKLDYCTLSISEKFTPLVYHYENDVFYGKCISHFTADTTFTLEEWIKKDELLVTEILEKNGQILIGVPSPIEYCRIIQSKE